MPGLTVTPTIRHENNDTLPKARNVSDVWAAQRVLHLDGEKYAGLSGLFVLRELMVRVSEIEKDLQVLQPQAFSSQSSPLFELLQPDLRESRHHASSDDDVSCYRPCHYFDFISGTSLGGSCAIMLGIMRFNVDEVIVQTKKLLTDLDSKVPKSSWSRLEPEIQALWNTIYARASSKEMLKWLEIRITRTPRIPPRMRFPTH
jgi:hypothetical protein